MREARDIKEIRILPNIQDMSGWGVYVYFNDGDKLMLKVYPRYGEVTLDEAFKAIIEELSLVTN